MKLDDVTYNTINNLMVYLREFDVVVLVNKHYAQYNNYAPQSLLQEQIEKVETILDEHWIKS